MAVYQPLPQNKRILRADGQDERKPKSKPLNRGKQPLRFHPAPRLQISSARETSSAMAARSDSPSGNFFSSRSFASGRKSENAPVKIAAETGQMRLHF